jgi:regulator of replication initiation timing
LTHDLFVFDHVTRSISLRVEYDSMTVTRLTVVMHGYRNTGHTTSRGSSKGMSVINARNAGRWRLRSTSSPRRRVNPTPAEQDWIVPTHDDELKSHFGAGFKRLVNEIVQQLWPTHQSLLMKMGAEVLALTATVAEMRDTIKSLTAQNEELRNELQTAHEKLNELTRAATAAPPPTRPPRAPSKRKRTESQVPHQLTKQVRDTSPTPTLIHSKHGGPIVTTEPTQPPRRHRNLPTVRRKRDGRRWKGRKGKGNGRRRWELGPLAASQPVLISNIGARSKRKPFIQPK